MIPRVLRALVVVLFATLISSCAKLPSIPVNQLGPEFTSNDTNESLYYSPAGPTEGITQEQVISGFIYAGNGPQDDYAVARKYLTKNYSSKWNPSAETLVQSGPTEVVSNTGTKIRLLVNFEARVNSYGNYLSEAGSSRYLEFKLLQEDGEWRISSAPNLTVLLAPNFKVLFQPIPVYFWDKSLSYLVPDVRWFPTRASLPTRLTNALIAGPSAWLGQAVQNVVPTGTKLNINSVTVEDGTASIDFNSTALKVPTWKRPYLRSQLLATLSSVEGVTQISVSVERTVQAIGAGASGVPEAASMLPIVLTKDGLSHIAGTSLFDILGTKALVDKQEATDFATSIDESVIVLLGQGKVMSYNLGLLNNATQLIDDRSKLLAPSIDPFNGVWTASAIAGASIRITDALGEQQVVNNPYGPRGVIRAIAVSAEGSRIAILHKQVRGVAVDVFAVLRDKYGKVTGFGVPLALKEFGTNVDAISWSGHSTLTGLTRDSIGFQSTVEVMVGGPKVIQRRTSAGVGAVTVMGGNQYYIDDKGGLFVSRSLGWDRMRSGISAIHIAGQ